MRELSKSATIFFEIFVQPVKQVTWHAKGDYFATVMPEGTYVIQLPFILVEGFEGLKYHKNYDNRFSLFFKI